MSSPSMPPSTVPSAMHQSGTAPTDDNRAARIAPHPRAQAGPLGPLAALDRIVDLAAAYRDERLGPDGFAHAICDALDDAGFVTRRPRASRQT